MPKKLKRLLFPHELIDHNVTHCQVQLRRLYHKYRRNPSLNLQELQREGELLIQEAYRKAQADVKAYVEKRGLKYEGDDAELKEGLTEMLERWRGIVNDF